MIVIGVQHQTRFIKPTIDLLGELSVNRKRVMLEISDYPIPLKIKEWDPEFYDYFSRVSQFVLAEGGEIIPGDSNDLLEQAKAEAERIEHLFYAAFTTQWVPAMEVICCKSRDPHFLYVANERNPEIVLLERVHTRYIREHSQCEYYYEL